MNDVPQAQKPSPSLQKATFGPDKFVTMCDTIAVPTTGDSAAKYATDPHRRTTSLQYVSGAVEHGGNDRAGLMANAVLQVLRQMGKDPKTFFLDWVNMFKGQPKLADISRLTQLVVEQDALFKSITAKTPKGTKAMADYYKGDKPIHAMFSDFCWGMDCIGFVGRYLEAGTTLQYPYRVPRQYLDYFKPVESIDEVDELCVGIRCDCTHINIIDWIDTKKRSSASIEAMICQSAGGGPRRDYVTFTIGTSDSDGSDDDEKTKHASDPKARNPGILDVATYNRDLAKFEADFKASLPPPPTPKPGAPKGPPPLTREQQIAHDAGLKKATAEAKERDRMMHATRGYRNGLIFMMSGGAEKNVTGLFYIARYPGGISKLYSDS